jgi:cupin superfamily acireductone dioxygenase involved in methionine salvage
LFSKATIEFDGKLKDNEFRYSVNVAGQSIFYVINKDKKFLKMFWVSQGITMVPKSDQENATNSESDIIE